MLYYGHGSVKRRLDGSMNGKRAKKIRKLTKLVFSDITKPEEYKQVYRITKERFKSGKIPG